ncbi:hypothetical protein U1Q18_005489 [Sarracenia purpurea var. burkii]
MQSSEAVKSDILLGLIVGGSPMPELGPGSPLCGGFRGKDIGGVRWCEQSSPDSLRQINARSGPLEEWQPLSAVRRS